MKRHNNGFTVIELIAVVIFLGLVAVLFYTQTQKADAANRDEQRKTAINAMYYSLEESYYAKHHNYPQTLSADTLPTMDKELLKDPEGIEIGTAGSDYSYDSINCNSAGECKGYTLKSNLENEADYTKNSRH